jgi:hypothetical protein
MLLLAKQSLDKAPYKLSGAVAKLASITFSRIVCSSPERLNLGFLLREKACCCAHHTFRLEFPNCLAIIIINYTPDITHACLAFSRGANSRFFILLHIKPLAFSTCLFVFGCATDANFNLIPSPSQ